MRSWTFAAVSDRVPNVAEKCGIFNHLFFDSIRGQPYHCAPMSIPRITRHVDFRKLAASGAHVGGVIPLDELQRIGQELVDRDGLVTVELDFGIDDEGHRIIEGHVEAELTLQCQRCLGAMQLPVDTEVQMAMVWSESEIASLPERFDGIVVGEEPGDLFDLVEDELLLALPFAPRHPQGECEVQGTGMTGEPDVTETGVQTRENPFAVLAKYKERPH